MVAWTEVSDGVLYTTEPLSVVGAADLAVFKDMAALTRRRRLRLCTHTGPDDVLQEMLIVASAETEIRPHRHLMRPESLHVIEGAADAVFFHDDGGIDRVERLAPYGAGGAFYYRIDRPQYHTLSFRTPWLVFVEATLGPFNPDRTEFAPWAPHESDTVDALRFRAELIRRLA